MMVGSALVSTAQTAFSEGFEGTTFPPTGWTLANTNPTNNWIRTTGTPISGTASAAVNWIAEDQDESLISPTFSLAGYTVAYLKFSVSLGYEYMVDPNPNGDLFVEISNNGGTTWSAPIWVEEDYGVFDDYEILNIQLNLAAYLGQTNLKVRFRYVAFDSDLVKLDDVSVTSCPATIDELTLEALTDTSYAVSWTSSAGVDVEYGPAGFVQGTGTMVTNTTSGLLEQSELTPGTGYSFYLRPNCGTSQGSWEGPYTIYTTLSTNATPDYAFGFETGNLGAGGWAAARVTANAGAIWGLLLGDDTDTAYDGTQFAAAGAFGSVSNAYLFSRGLDLTAGTPYNFTYYQREMIGAGNGGANMLAVKIGTAKTVAGMTTTLTPSAAVGEAVWTLKTASFTPTTSGVYYLGFQYTCTAQAQANFGWACIDGFVADNTLSVEDDLMAAFTVLPNPASDVISIMNSKNIPLKAVTVTDVNGRVVKRNQYSDVFSVDMNLTDLSAGMYIMNIETAQGAVTKKIVKK